MLNPVVTPLSKPPSLDELRADARTIFDSAVAAANPYQAVKNCLNPGRHHLEILLNPEMPDLIRTGRWPRVLLLAFGKAACAMADAAQAIIPPHLRAGNGIAVTNYENVRPVDHIDVLGAGHPLPDEAGISAVQAIREKLLNVCRDDLVLVMVSGGGSALLPAPRSPVTLAEKISITEALMASGATIQEINCVRKHLSSLKGGGLAKLSAPADMHTLILSDVVDDDLSVIASGPTVADASTFSDAKIILKNRKLWQDLPTHVQTLLTEGEQGLIPETPKPNDCLFKRISHTLVGSNRLSLNAALQAAARLNYRIIQYNDQLTGEAKHEAEKLVFFIRGLVNKGYTEPTAIIAGGETTVTLYGDGKGGRNQEFALAFALAAERQGLASCWILLSGGTDGRDGPTDAAGAIIDGQTLHRLRMQGIDPRQLLANNDSYTALSHSGDLLVTGPTGTNVADLQIALIHPFLS